MNIRHHNNIMILPSRAASRSLQAARLLHRSTFAADKVELQTWSSWSPNPRCRHHMCSPASVRDNCSRSPQLPRMIPSVSHSSLGKPENNNFVEFAKRNHSNNEHQQNQSYGVSNFTKMLQYQDFPRTSRRGDSTIRGNDNDAARRRDTRPYQRDDVPTQTITTAETKLNANINSINDYAYRSKNRERTISHERPRWRSRKAPTLPKISANSKVSTSEWIQISGTPPMSKLSDLFPCLNQIIDYELQKGIIDLDALQDETYFDSRARANALNAIGALDTLYPTRRIDNGSSDIPLWSPYSSDHPHSLGDACPMILEARIQLSYRARPMGWFLRLPNRSVVHAVLNHVRRGRQKKWYSPNEDSNLKQQKREWREGLWKGVYADYESVAEKKDVQVAIEHEESDEKELMWVDGEWGKELKDDLLFECASEGGIEVVRTPKSVEPQNDVDSYVQRYSQSHPYPTQLTTQSAGQTSPYQIMKSGSTILSIREFSPYPTDIASFRNEYLPWEQHAFHLCPHLNLSDSVVRVETSDLTANEADIQFFFRGYDLKCIPVPEEKTTSVPALLSCFTDFPQSIGWNIKSDGNVNMLVEGIHAPQYNHPSDRKRGSTIRANRHTFLVRFASPSDARMAVRDNDGKVQAGHRWSACQYPSSVLDNIDKVF